MNDDQHGPADCFSNVCPFCVLTHRNKGRSSRRSTILVQEGGRQRETYQEDDGQERRELASIIQGATAVHLITNQVVRSIFVDYSSFPKCRKSPLLQRFLALSKLPNWTGRWRVHHAAVPYGDVAAFKARKREATSPLALELRILTASRSGRNLGNAMVRNRPRQENLDDARKPNEGRSGASDAIVPRELSSSCASLKS